MQKVILLKGLPASGKSTWAKEQVLKGNGKVKRINKDELRSMLDSSVHSKDRESMITSVRDDLARKFLREGKDVIIDDTNFHPKHEEALRWIATETASGFEVKEFPVLVTEAILRDATRPKPVGPKVIMGMFDQSVRKTYKFDPSKKDAIIVDIDGTLAHADGRSPYDYTKVSEDKHDAIIRDLVLRYRPSHSILIVSGRESSCRAATEAWLTDNLIPYNGLFMRAEGDKRCDTIVKEEIFNNYIDPTYNVHFALDDRNRVVDMWREKGIKVLQVNYGFF